MSEGFGVFLGLMVGAILGMLFLILFRPPSLQGAQYKYLECVKLGAPEQNCLKAFLLPQREGGGNAE
jgi:hypothetical protein